MKTKITQAVLLISVIVSLSVSCKKEDNGPAVSTLSASAIITSGSWRVSYYHESGDDHTINFSGYTFTFSSNGTMTATNSSGTTSGTWKIDDRNKNEFHMDLGSASPCSVMNHGWLIISKTSSEMGIKDDDMMHNEELHFTKI